MYKKLKKFEDKILERVSGYEKVNHVIWNCWNLAKELGIEEKIIGFFLYDDKFFATKNLSITFESDDPELIAENYEICFG